MMDIDTIVRLMARMRAGRIAELTWEKDGERVHLVADGRTVLQADETRPSPDAGGSALDAAGVTDVRPPPNVEEIITAPMHGLFYVSPAPDAPPFAAPGQRIEAGGPLCILEVMKTLSRMEAEYACIVRRVLCGNAQAVEPGTPLFAVERIRD